MVLHAGLLWHFAVRLQQIFAYNQPAELLESSWPGVDLVCLQTPNELCKSGSKQGCQVQLVVNNRRRIAASCWLLEHHL